MLNTPLTFFSEEIVYILLNDRRQLPLFFFWIGSHHSRRQGVHISLYFLVIRNLVCKCIRAIRKHGGKHKKRCRGLCLMHTQNRTQIRNGVRPQLWIIVNYDTLRENLAFPILRGTTKNEHDKERGEYLPCMRRWGTWGTWVMTFRREKVGEVEVKALELNGDGCTM